MQRSLLFVVAGLCCAAQVHADRITQMTREERCVYVARLHAAAAYHHGQGRTREQVTIHWHGDETDNEVGFVNRTLDDAYQVLAREVAAGRREVPAEYLGDQAYAKCLREAEL